MGQPARQLVPSAAPAPAPPLPFLLQPGPVRTPRIGVAGYASVLRQNTGATWGAESWCEGQERQGKLSEQTRRLADVLERNGITTRLPSEVMALGEVTGGTALTESWRAIRFLPAVAQRDRKPVLNALKLWQRTAGGKWLRYAVVTSGARVPLGGPGDLSLRKRQSEHTRNVSRWAHDARKDYGVEVVFRATEFTVNDDGVHLHSNVLYRPNEKMSAERWSEFLAWSGKRLGAHWKDCGLVEDMNEVVKYALKPSEVEGLADAHVVWLYENLFGAKLCQPMGVFAEWLTGLAQDRLKVAQVVDAVAPAGERKKSRLRLVEKPCRETAAQRRAKEKDDKDDDVLGDAPDTPDVGDAPVEVEPPGRKAPGENVLVARTLPQPKFSPWSEPLSLVLNYTENPVTPDGIRRLELLRERRAEARTWWDANGAPAPEVALEAGKAAGPGAIKVHTGSPTVQDGTAPPPPRRVVSAADGSLVDAATGEVLFEPVRSPPSPRERWQYHWVSAAVRRATVRSETAAAAEPRKYAVLARQCKNQLEKHKDWLRERRRNQAAAAEWQRGIADCIVVGPGDPIPF